MNARYQYKQQKFFLRIQSQEYFKRIVENKKSLLVESKKMKNFLIFFITISVISIVNSQNTVDCTQAPPSNVDPLSCCPISRPFNRDNFPDCFTIENVNPPTVRNVRTNINDFNINDNRNTVDPSDILVPEVNEPQSGENDRDRRQNWNNGNQNRGRENNGNERRQSNGNGRHSSNSDGDHHGWHHGGWGHWRHHHDSDSGQRDYHRFRSEQRYRSKRQATRIPPRGGRQTLRTRVSTNSINCPIQCIFNQTKIIANDKFNRDVALVVYAKYYPELPVDLLTKTIDKCAKQVIAIQNRALLQNDGVIRSRGCRNGSGIFADCFSREIFSNCPADVRTNSDDCSALRDFIDNCSPLRGIRGADIAFNISVNATDFS